jgi:hypothetical protein
MSFENLFESLRKVNEEREINPVGAVTEVPGKIPEENPHINDVENNPVDFGLEFMKAGYSKGEDINPDPEQLQMGIEVEMEHTTSEEIARKIAMDHLVEIPDYYTRLKAMEDEAKGSRTEEISQPEVEQTEELQ